VQKPKVFRVFLSSTFKDLEAERNVLHREVFPRLREFCLARGARFQPVDLRWGVSEEASVDQRAMNICLAEVARCREVTPRPNFIVLLGNRHGWLALPPQIPAAEFEAIRGQVPSRDDRDLLARWYRRDDNAVPPEYCLRARTGELGRFQERDRWAAEEGRLGAILRAVVNELDLPEADRRKYEASATEQEIVAGALDVSAPQGHAFAFIRELTGDYPDPAEAAAGEAILDYADPDQAPLDRLKNLIRSALPVRTYPARWDPRHGNPTTDHLDGLARDVREALEATITAELEDPRPAPAGRHDGIGAHPALDAEGQAHRDFASERARNFVGRDDTLAMIARHLAGPSSRALVICGDGGAGKSALLAEALRRAQRDQPGADVVYRFIGATPGSFEGRALLRGLSGELARRGYGPGEAKLPDTYPDLVTDFRKRLAQAGPNQPLVVILDSLDQLSASHGARDLAWLPAPPPAAVRMVVSTRPADTLQALVRCGALVEELGPMAPDDSRELLQRWLGEAHRTLRDAQEEQVLAGFAASSGNPLYLRLAFEEARRWTSDDPPAVLAAGVEAIIAQNTFARLATEDGHGTVLVSRALGYLAASRYGLAEDELLDVLSRDPEVYEWFLRGAQHLPPDFASQAAEYLGAGQPTTGWLEAIRQDEGGQAQLRGILERILPRPDGPRLPVVLWSRLAFDLRPYLTERGAEEAVLTCFFHRELADAARALYLDGSGAAQCHGRLAAYFRPRPGEDGQPLWAAAPVHALSELPYHLANAGEDRRADLVATLTDFGFL